MTRDDFHRPHVQAALRISVISVVWTVIASVAAVGVGLASGTVVLVAFGAIGIVDAVGSVALAHHFRRGLLDDTLSDRTERVAHLVVLGGLFGVGSSAIVAGGVRLLMGAGGDGSAFAVALAAVSLAALLLLSARKLQVARRVSSAALRSDGHLSGVGALQAAVTLAGTVVTRALGWTWADAAATGLIGCVAVALAITTWRAEHHGA